MLGLVSGTVRAMKIGSAVMAISAMLLSLSSPADAATGTVRITFTKAGFIIGAGGGSGVLHFNGRYYPLSVGGMSIGTIGAAKADLSGHAYHLRTAADILGTYTAVSGGISVAGGVKSARLQNANGVILQLHGRQAGFEASLSLSGMTISRR